MIKIENIKFSVEEVPEIIVKARLQLQGNTRLSRELYFSDKRRTAVEYAKINMLKNIEHVLYDDAVKAVLDLKYTVLTELKPEADPFAIMQRFEKVLDLLKIQ